MKSLNISEARRSLPSLADEVNSTGVPVIITRRGQPLVKLVPFDQPEEGDASYSLRGLPVRISEDFDEPLDDLWEAAKA